MVYTKKKNDDRYLCHYGIKGQKKGVRRYQNEDGTLTAEGLERYRKEVRPKKDTALKNGFQTLYSGWNGMPTSAREGRAAADKRRKEEYDRKLYQSMIDENGAFKDERDRKTFEDFARFCVATSDEKAFNNVIETFRKYCGHKVAAKLQNDAIKIKKDENRIKSGMPASEYNKRISSIRKKYD